MNYHRGTPLYGYRRIFQPINYSRSARRHLSVSTGNTNGPDCKNTRVGSKIVNHITLKAKVDKEKPEFDTNYDDLEFCFD